MVLDDCAATLAGSAAKEAATAAPITRPRHQDFRDMTSTSKQRIAAGNLRVGSGALSAMPDELAIEVPAAIVTPLPPIARRCTAEPCAESGQCLTNALGTVLSFAPKRACRAS